MFCTHAREEGCLEEAGRALCTPKLVIWADANRAKEEMGVERQEKIRDNKWCMFGKYSHFPDDFIPAPKHNSVSFPLELDAAAEKWIMCFSWRRVKLCNYAFSVLSEKVWRVHHPVKRQANVSSPSPSLFCCVSLGLCSILLSGNTRAHLVSSQIRVLKRFCVVLQKETLTSQPMQRV